MKVAIFGGSGFLGSHVAETLTEKGHDVVVFDKVKSPYIMKDQTMVMGDILDEVSVNKAIMGCEAVYNFAGIADIGVARINPVETIRQNILGNTIILEACRKNGVKRFLFSSSIYVYSNSGSFYRSSKQSSELIIEDYQKTHGLEFTIMRYGSLYGPRTDGGNWIYSMLKQALTENRIVRKGDGEEVREYIHVRDAARISVEVLDKQYANQYVIISGNQTIKIKDLLLMIREMLNNNIKIEYSASGLEEHYEITPYSFNPKIAKKIVSNSYLDLGQGMLDMIERIHRELHGEKPKVDL